MALATVDDVKRVLRLGETSTETDEDLAEFLAAAESDARRFLRQDHDAGTPGTAKFYDVIEDGRVRIPDGVTAVTAVRTYTTASATSGSTLQASEYAVEDGRWVRLVRPLVVTPFEGATATRVAQTHGRVEVDYTPSGTVPKGVRDGVALWAGILYVQSPRWAGGLESEKIGDYMYSVLKGAAGDAIDPLDVARKRLRPYRRSGPAVVG